MRSLLSLNVTIYRLSVISAASILLLSKHVFADELNDDIKSILQNRFAAAVFLSDTDAIEFGIASFDPNQVLNTDNEDLGSQQALNERRSKSVYVLPYLREFRRDESPHRHQLLAKGFLIDTENRFSLDEENLPKDRLDELTVGAALGYGYQYNVNEVFSVTPSLIGHVIYYQNDYTANSDISRLVEIFLDGRVFNVSAWSAIAEPAIDFDYHHPRPWGKWHFNSKWSYFYGTTWGSANNGDIGNPQGWYVTNQVTVYWDLFDRTQSLFTGFKRVDLSPELQSELGTDHYYESSIGWLFQDPVRWEWLDNVGVGLTFNYGSSINGGSLMFYYNK